MTPNYIDSSSLSVAPWCDCFNSGNDLEECLKFLNFFKDNKCLSELKKKGRSMQTYQAWTVPSCFLCLLPPSLPFFLSPSLSWLQLLLATLHDVAGTTWVTNWVLLRLWIQGPEREQEIQMTHSTLCGKEQFHLQIKFWSWQPAESQFPRFWKPGQNIQCERFRQIR